MEKNGPQTMDQMDGNLEAPDNIRDCKLVNNDMENNLLETDLTVESLAECPKAAAGSTENISEVNTGSKKKKIGKKIKKAAKIQDEIQNLDQTKMDTGSTENLAEKNVNGKRKRRGKKKKAKNKDETQSVDQVDGMLNLHLSDGNHGEGIDQQRTEKECTAQEPGVSVRKELSLSDLMHNKENPLDFCKDEEAETSVKKESSLSGLMHEKENPLDLSKETVLLPDVVEVSSIQVSSEVVEERSEHVLRPMEVDGKLIPCESQLSAHPYQVAAENPKPENGLNEVNDEIVVYKGKCSAEVSVRKESSLSDLLHKKENPLDLSKETVLLPDVVEVSSNRVSSEVVEERSKHVLRPMEVDGKLISCESQLSTHPNQVAAENPKPENGLNEVNDEIVVYQGKCSAQGRSVFSTCDAEVTRHLSSCVVNEAEWLSKDLGQYPRVAPIPSIKRKLIVLDVNGLLANIVMPAPKDCRGDVHILGRAIFRRPFCDDFLKFCFQNFDVGVWSSRSKKIIDRVVDYLLGELTDKLLFCWDMSHSTQTGFNTLENIHKPLVFKELRKIWENDDPNLPWKNGDYNESNTLLLDDSPYKALLNPLHTAIFPNSYHYLNKNDNSIGPGGDLRVYLEELLTSENVQKYVEQHPFGQSAINETNLSWGFYSGVLQTMSNQLQNNTPSSLPTLSWN